MQSYQKCQYWVIGFYSNESYPPVGLDLMITGSRDYHWFKSLMLKLTELIWHGLISLRLLDPSIVMLC